MEQEVIEFKKQHCRSRKGCLGRVRNSWGVYDAYKHIRKNHWYNLPRKVTEGEFYSIIRMVNTLLADNLSHGYSVEFPSRMGSLELRKHKSGCSIVDGKLRIDYPVDWAETWTLWASDAESYKQRRVKYNENTFTYYTKYRKDNAKYRNKQFYHFALNSTVKRQLKDNIKQGITDTLWLQK